MTLRFTNPRPQFLDSSGNPLLSGRLFFYETGTSTLKTVYADANETTVAPTDGDGAVPLAADGRVPNIFYSGTARVVLQNDAGAGYVQIWDIDGVGAFGDGSAFSVWNAVTEYQEGSIVEASDDLYYRSLANNNIGNDPTTSAAFWEQVSFLRTWNTNVSYSINDLVQASNGKFYVSLNNNNAGNEPSANPANWELYNPFDQDLNTTSSPTFAAITSTGTVQADGGMNSNTINERTATAGVTIDSVLLKDGGGTFSGVIQADGGINSNTINEVTADAGVTIDSVLLKDGGGTFSGVIQADGGMNSNTINEVTPNAGVTIDGAVIKDGELDISYVGGYETGTWTPTLEDTSFNPSEGQTYTLQKGFYTKVGNLVTIQGEINMSSLGTLSGSRSFIGGLPFTPAERTSGFCGIGFNLGITAGVNLTLFGEASVAALEILQWDSTTGTGVVSPTTHITSNGSINFSASYRI